LFHHLADREALLRPLSKSPQHAFLIRRAMCAHCHCGANSCPAFWLADYQQGFVPIGAQPIRVLLIFSGDQVEPLSIFRIADFIGVPSGCDRRGASFKLRRGAVERGVELIYNPLL
jgi:hypothetical protein